MTARRPLSPSLPGFRPPAPEGIKRSHARKAWRRLVSSIRSRASAANGSPVKGFVRGATFETDNGRYIERLGGDDG